MTRPNFLILGAQKAGSSWLVANLQKHADVFLSPRELQFFNLESNFASGVDWYEQQFETADADALVVGEKTPNYMWITSEDVRTPFGTHRANLHRDVAALIPHGKFVVMLRDPVQRAVSAVNHYMRYGQLSPFRDIDEYLVGSHTDQAARYGVFEMGEYNLALGAYFSVLDREQFLVLEFANDVVAEPTACISSVCEFLGIELPASFDGVSDAVNEFSQRSIGVSYATHLVPRARRTISQLESRVPSRLRSRFVGPPVTKQRPSAAALDRLAERFQGPNRLLFELLGVDYPHWLSGG